MAILEFRAMEVVQGGYHFFVGSCSGKALLEIAYVQRREEGEGVQRILSAKRLQEIGEYLTSGKQPGLLPNSIVLALEPGAKFDRRSSLLSIPRKSRQAFVVDGQHRLFAFKPEYVGDFDMDVPVSAFTDLEWSDIAFLFRTINSTQRKINPSLVYDLIPMMRDRDWVAFEDSRAQYLVQRLNDEETSPWYRRISMLGGRDQPITQASFISAIKGLLKPGEVLSESFSNADFFGEEIQYELLETYFRAISQVFADEWLNDNFVVSKNLGVSALLRLLAPVLGKVAGRKKSFFNGDYLALKPEDFHRELRKARSAVTWSRSEMAKSYLGAAGIRTLTEELRVAIGSKAE